MAAGGGAPPQAGWAARFESLLGTRPVRQVRAILGRYQAAGGGLLASGLAYAALFALVPGILLILGIAGTILGDGQIHDDFVQNVIAVIPPLEELLVPAVDELTRQAGSMTLLGAVGLAWGSSRFYEGFEAALARVFGGVSSRGFIQRTLLGLLSIAVLGLLFGLVTILAGLAGLLVDLAGPAATTLALAGVYRMVPPRRPAWHTIAVPSIVVTAVLVLIVRLFVFLAPRLIGAAAVLGTLATVFAALAWLSLSFQVVLLGAAWIDLRDRRAAAGTTVAP